MIRWFANARARAAYAKLGKSEAEFDLFAFVAIAEFWLIAIGIVLLFIFPWAGIATLILAALLFIGALLISG